MNEKILTEAPLLKVFSNRSSTIAQVFSGGIRQNSLRSKREAISIRIWNEEKCQFRIVSVLFIQNPFIFGAVSSLPTSSFDERREQKKTQKSKLIPNRSKL